MFALSQSRKTQDNVLERVPAFPYREEDATEAGKE